MFLDAQLQFSDAQAVTTDAASTNIIDLGAPRNIFDGEPLAVFVVVDVAADFTTANETYSFEIQTDDNASFSSATVLVAHSVVATALTAGTLFVIPIPVGAAVERYLRLNYDTGGTTPTITVTAFLEPLSMIDKYKSYADNFAIQ